MRISHEPQDTLQVKVDACEQLHIHTTYVRSYLIKAFLAVLEPQFVPTEESETP